MSFTSEVFGRPIFAPACCSLHFFLNFNMNREMPRRKVLHQHISIRSAGMLLLICVFFVREEEKKEKKQKPVVPKAPWKLTSH